jgi:hypothetical protein
VTQHFGKTKAWEFYCNQKPAVFAGFDSHLADDLAGLVFVGQLVILL